MFNADKFLMKPTTKINTIVSKLKRMERIAESSEIPPEWIAAIRRDFQVITTNDKPHKIE
ncbi:hypothetical protein [Oceanibaculum indicum]|uniref:hypothetical protein n=1 Tax=Oceanibaculum indicum TaxID=526216 RepID=UPI00178C79ED|nr:hypothetical protein [Oceanibaculum indicum]